MEENVKNVVFPCYDLDTVNFTADAAYKMHEK